MTTLQAALADGDPAQVAALLDGGTDIHYQDENGYDALINAVHGRDMRRDPRLLDLLTLLIARGAALRGKSSYGETGVRVLSRLGRFDAVRLLLDAGADPDDLQNTPLLEAVTFGTLADVQNALSQGADLEGRDFWERTAYLVATQIGDIAKARLLKQRGADTDARGRCGKPPLFYPIENAQTPMLEWLLAAGADTRQTDKFGNTPLICAADCDNIEAIDVLLRAGADVNYKHRRTDALGSACSRDAALRLLEAGADPQQLSHEAQRAILDLPGKPDAALLQVSPAEFAAFRAPRFGTTNPEQMNNPFWDGMIRSGVAAYQAEVFVEGEREYVMPGYDPIWCASRFGQSLTFLGDGRMVQIGGEHEDSYDPDFCIYNDVFVHSPDGSIVIYGYPKAVFPPTDFHTATLAGDSIYIIGSLGYQGTRRFGETPVCRLSTRTFHLEPLTTTGPAPGWIYKYRAALLGGSEIRITGGTIAQEIDGTEDHVENNGVFVLNVQTLALHRAD